MSLVYSKTQSALIVSCERSHGAEDINSLYNSVPWFARNRGIVVEAVANGRRPLPVMKHDPVSKRKTLVPGGASAQDVGQAMSSTSDSRFDGSICINAASNIALRPRDQRSCAEAWNRLLVRLTPPRSTRDRLDLSTCPQTASQCHVRSSCTVHQLQPGVRHKLMNRQSAMDVEMSFRIDDIRRTSPNQWEFDMVGLYGWPCFAVLQTDETGHGLSTDETHLANLVLWEIAMPKSRRHILGTANFKIPEHAEQREALRILTVALTSIGWGSGSTGPHLLRRLTGK